jgi:hypothetical protein
MSSTDRREFDKARQEIARLMVINDRVIAVLTASQADLARKVVVEAGRERR